MGARAARRLAAVAAALALTVTFDRAAYADPTPAEKETARGLVEEGDRRLEAHDLPGALKAYEAAHAIMGVPSTGVEVAKTLDKLGRLTEARDLALGIAQGPPKPGEPRAFIAARAEAEKLADAIASRIPALVIEVRGAPSG